MNIVMIFQVLSLKAGNILTNGATVSFSRRTMYYGNSWLDKKKENMTDMNQR